MKINFNLYWRKFGTFVILIVIVSLFGMLSPKYFFSTDNLIAIALQSMIVLLVSLGEFFAILNAGIDLSVGSVVAVTGMITAKLLVSGFPVIPAMLIGGIGVGLVLGAINGGLVYGTKLHPFIITLGTMSIYRGFTLVISNAHPVYGFPQFFKNIVVGSLWKIPNPVIIAAVVTGILIFITNKTKFGRNLYALGGNKKAAWFAGISIKWHTIMTFIISGITAGIAGVVMIARLGAAEPLGGSGLELFAIASVIIGGASFFGGVGKISGVVIGSLVLGVINNGLNILNIPTFYQQIVLGSLIIIAVTLDRTFSAKR